jgi:hypothetical protein
MRTADCGRAIAHRRPSSAIVAPDGQAVPAARGASKRLATP